MAGPLTEVTVAFRLPEDPLTKFMEANPHARIALTPLHINGASPPNRYLVTAHAPGRRPVELDHALGRYFSPLEPLNQDTSGNHSYIGMLHAPLRDRIETHIATLLEGTPGDVIHRPWLITGRQTYASLVTTRPGPLEQGVQRLIQGLNKNGLQARLVRLGPHRSNHNPDTYEEALTEKQSEFLRVALALGLYDTPRRITLDQLASIFGISKAAAHNRMRSAERKVLNQYFGA